MRINKKPFTEVAFENLLDKASQPLPERGQKPDSVAKKTSDSHLSDDYNETHIHPDSCPGT